MMVRDKKLKLYEVGESEIERLEKKHRKKTVIIDRFPQTDTGNIY